MLRTAHFSAPLATAACLLSMAVIANAQYPTMPAAAMAGGGLPVPPGYGQMAPPAYDLNYVSQQAGYPVQQADYPAVQQVGYPVQQAGCNSGCPGCNNCYGDYYGNGGGGFRDARSNSYGSDPYGGYGSGGVQCRPRWFDVYTEVMYLKRDNTGRNVNLISQGAMTNVFILSTDDLTFDEELGIRLTLALQIGPGASMEGSYYDVFNWSSSAAVAGANMFSLFNGFGTTADVGTDDATSASITYSSELRSAELNWKRRYCSGSGRVQYAWLLGARYIDLEEDFQLVIGTAGDTTNYAVATSNRLIGFQTGFESWVCILPRLTIGADCKAGVYANQTDQATSFTTTFGGGAANFNERPSDTDIALAAEANIMAVINITPQWSFRAGYQAFYLDGVTLASENINADVSDTRVATINTNGSAFYHGGTGGFEFIW